MPATTLVRPDGTSGFGAHLARPVGAGPWPGVVVLHEAFGLTDDIREITARFADAGYLALAPDLYSDGGARRCLVGTFKALARGRGRAFDDIETSRAFLAGHRDCAGRVGVAGFCMGGGFALLSAARGFDAAAPNYGVLPKDLDGALQGACPVVASYGARDRALRGAAATLEAALTRNGIPHDVEEYPEAGHSFFNRQGLGPLGAVLRITGVGFHQASSEDGWRRILAFYGEHLAADAPDDSAADR